MAASTEYLCTQYSVWDQFPCGNFHWGVGRILPSGRVVSGVRLVRADASVVLGRILPGFQSLPCVEFVSTRNCHRWPIETAICREDWQNRAPRAKRGGRLRTLGLRHLAWRESGGQGQQTRLSFLGTCCRRALNYESQAQPASAWARYGEARAPCGT